MSRIYFERNSSTIIYDEYDNDVRKMNIKINIPTETNELIYTLQSHGHTAYVVGGAVRNSLLNLQIKDWDICTSATPDEMLKIFKHRKIIETGLQHGTVTVVINGESFEITTYRIDGNYSDGRHPDSVEFTSSLIEDLSRRDFTINAMAYNNEEGLIDPFNGLEDLENRIIRCVGNPEDRFNEDALRILRAVRFACQLDFNIHGSIGWAIGYTNITNNLKNISVERINSEFVKIVNTNQFYKRLVWNYNVFVTFIPELEDMFRFPQNNPYHDYDVFGHTLHALKHCESKDLIVRLAVFFHDFGKPYCHQDGEDGIRHFKGHGLVSSELAYLIMKRLRFDNLTTNNVVELVHYHDATFEVGKKYVKRWLNKIGEEQFRRLLEVRKADIKGQKSREYDERLDKVKKIKEILEEVLQEKECFSLKDLAVNGNDLINIGYKTGKELGITLNKLLDFTIEGKVINDKKELLKLAKEWL